MEKAIFGASEFFSQEAFVTGFRGIENVRRGQLKGTNIEIVEIWFDPWKVSYEEVVNLFFDLHDPTATKGQTIKNQSFIFFTDHIQLTKAKQKKKELKHLVKNEVITDIIPVERYIDRLKESRLIS
ncbi:peptide-methionine (S)-S-oxide reductase [Halalkalibacter krulwichiae]|uniref:peptide-methionine (S)-S-oxide reductase n=1 Tax=Halalkalibacter krulwichiae TaxID=199441 RepID=A0A1X9M9D2_9BACI|nr:peptide-methionine (S)-S-oxide reductase [Halalkalibacter krulwichiae]ARK30018.1 Peptide methionine sulfoxide reductase MsrA 3 [Halalkalibacter krulwichiae]